jgi:ATP-dependent helicase/nuclease subunit B
MASMHVVTGPFRPALEGAFRDTVAALRRDDPISPLAVIAPSKRLADRLKDLALEALPEGFAGVRFFNLFSFARTIYEEEAAVGQTLVLDKLLPERLLRTILKRHFAAERYLQRAMPAPQALLGALHELKAGGVDPDKALVALAEDVLGWEDAGKLSELFSLYKRYEDELRRRKIHERSDVIRLACRHAATSKVLGSFKNLLYYGFYDLDQNQIDLLREVRRRVPCTVFFPYLDTPGYAYAKPFLEEILLPMAGTVKRLPEPPPPTRVAQLSTSGAHDEVWAAAKEILRFADRGIPFAEIGVVARTLDPYVDPIETLFQEHRIPFTSSATRPLSHDPRIKAARLLFTIDDFDRADVLDLLRSPFLKDRRGDRSLWDPASRRMGIGTGADEWRKRLGAAAGKNWVHGKGGRAGAPAFELPREEVDLFWSAVRALIDAPPPPDKGWKDYADWALDRIHRFLEPDPRIDAAVQSLTVLEGFALEEPREALLRVLSGLSEPVGGGSGVRVLDAMAARGSAFRALIVLGMNERSFPRFILQDAFLSDTVRSRMDARLGTRIPRRREGYAEERLLFTLLESSADETIFIYQRSDERGRLQISSPFLPKPEEDSGKIQRRPSLRLAQAEFEILTPREAALRTGQGEALSRAMGRDVGLLVNATQFIKSIERWGKPTSYDGVVDTRHYWPALAGFGISPTALERLAECPFKFFAHGMLSLEELEEPEGETMITPLEIGNLYHAILEQYHRAGNLDRRLAEGFADFEASRSIRYPVLWEVERESITNVLRAIVDADDTSVFKPRDHEVELKGELAIDAGGRKAVTFRGYADRLDVAESGAFRVVDYKRSGRKYPLKMETGVFEKGKYLQPPLYFLLAQKMLGVPGVDSKFSYYFLDDVLEKETWEKELTGDMWERRPEFEAHLRAHLERIAAGEFLIKPGGHCDFCDFRAICRKSHRPTSVRAEEAFGTGGKDEES